MGPSLTYGGGMDKKREAFSLIELVIVIGIMGVLISLVVFRAGVLEDHRAKRDLERMVADMKAIRKEAIQAREETAIEVSQEGYVLLVGQEEIRRVVTSPGLVLVSSSHGSGGFSFSSTGRPSLGGRLHFRIGSQDWTLVVEPVNGRISLREGDS